mmetsp:Transcript_65850/g.175070  ORF Transcript_65850/g.175070 Transcript_65850/m.175070 type:complete len:103 (-) Transcript_65850:109-417(-)
MNMKVALAPLLLLAAAALGPGTVPSDAGLPADATVLMQTGVGEPVIRKGQRRTGPTAVSEDPIECDDPEEDDEEGAVLMQSSLKRTDARMRFEEELYDDTWA